MRSSFIAATLSLALAISPIAFKAQAESSGQSSAETYQQLTLFGDVLERVRAEYVTELTDKELIEAAINGMLTSLDPHSGRVLRALRDQADPRPGVDGALRGRGLGGHVDRRLRHPHGPRPGRADGPPRRQACRAARVPCPGGKRRKDRFSAAESSEGFEAPKLRTTD